MLVRTREERLGSAAERDLSMALGIRFWGVFVQLWLRDLEICVIPNSWDFNKSRKEITNQTRRRGRDVVTRKGKTWNLFWFSSRRSLRASSYAMAIADYSTRRNENWRFVWESTLLLYSLKFEIVKWIKALPWIYLVGANLGLLLIKKKQNKSSHDLFSLSFCFLPSFRIIWSSSNSTKNCVKTYIIHQSPLLFPLFCVLCGNLFTTYAPYIQKGKNRWRWQWHK